MTAAGSQRPSFWPKKSSAELLGHQFSAYFWHRICWSMSNYQYVQNLELRATASPEFHLCHPLELLGVLAWNFPILEFTNAAGLWLSSLVSHSIGALYLPCIPSAAPHAGAFFFSLSVCLLLATGCGGMKMDIADVDYGHELFLTLLDFSLLRSFSLSKKTVWLLTETFWYQENS